MLPQLAFTLCAGALVAASVTRQPALDVSVRSAPGMTPEQTIHAIRRGLANASLEERQDGQGNSTPFQKSFNNAVLFRYDAEISTEIEVDLPKDNEATVNSSLHASVEVLCRTCYIKGTANVNITTDKNFDASVAIQSIENKFEAVIDDMTNYVNKYIRQVFDKVKEQDISSSAFDMPPLDVDLNLDIQGIPECQLHFGFDGLELYMDTQLTMTAGATYSLNLYTSVTPLGFKVGDVLVGVTFAVDLLLSVESEISVASGFHLKLDDGIAIDIALFSDEVSDIVFNGGQFEFLPVTVESDGVTFRALLRVAIHAGLELHTPFLPDLSVGDFEFPSAGVGIELAVWANLADLTTSIIPGSADSDVRRRDDDDQDDDEQEDGDCRLRVRQEFVFALGAAAGATVAIMNQTWGPAPSTEIPIWYTTLADECVVSPKATAASTPRLGERQDDEEEEEDRTTTTLTKETVFTALECISIGPMNCPASSQSLREVTEVQTLVTAVASGIEAEWPEVTAMTINRVVEFGSGALGLESTSGSPVSYVPPPPPPTESPTSDGKVGGVDKKVILGVSIGLGVPVLLAVIASIIFLIRRRRGALGTVFQPDQTNIQYTVETQPKSGDIQHEARSAR
ncbi:hypothetical protein BN1723_003875 [Verticillium longisporum]|uniref:Mid2 domain-containing protein n=1 Tax=Verticillium longisporum TaxID=100787 RepID=A0A0G4ME09_VERLO|nr:hypothetical protein BN1708_005055 [Verticillium longisporum]CRK32220.1 hypothetical protein BN1723_003875 [Verticillium longisporum]